MEVHPMTKKHFIAMADAMREASRKVWQLHRDGVLTEEQAALVVTCYETELADFCKQENGAFNRHRWMGYIHGECGPNGGAI